MKKSLLAATAALALALSGCAAQPQAEEALPEKIVLAGLPLDENPDVSARYQITIDLLEEATGLPVEFYEAADYAAVIEGLAAGRAHLAQLDALTFVSAQNLNPDVQALLGTSRLPTERENLVGFGITRTDSGITRLEDLRGKKVCFPDPSGSVGYLWPALALTKVGIDPDATTSQDITALFTGTHPSVAQAVYNGDCEAGFVADITWDKIAPKDETIEMSELATFWESDGIPFGPMAVNASALPQSLRDVIKSTLLEKANKDYLVEAGICDDAATCLHLAGTSWGYVEVENSYFDSVREVCDTLKLERCATKPE